RPESAAGARMREGLPSSRSTHHAPRERIMPPYLRLGSIPRKRHIAHPQQPGFKGEGIYYEEVVTLAGFGRAYSLVYHLRPPTRVTRLEPAGTVALELGEEATLRHHHFKTRAIPRSGDPISG